VRHGYNNQNNIILGLVGYIGSSTKSICYRHFAKCLGICANAWKNQAFCKMPRRKRHNIGRCPSRRLQTKFGRDRSRTHEGDAQEVPELDGVHRVSGGQKVCTKRVLGTLRTPIRCQNSPKNDWKLGFGPWAAGCTTEAMMVRHG
jgi:hypothetical protein